MMGDHVTDIQISYALNDILAGYQTRFDQLPPSARVAAIRALIDNTLAEKQAELKVEDNGRVSLIRKDGSNVFGEDNRQWDLKSLVDHTLSRSGVVTGPGERNNIHTATTSANTAPASKSNTLLSQLVKKSIHDQDEAEKYSTF